MDGKNDDDKHITYARMKSDSIIVCRLVYDNNAATCKMCITPPDSRALVANLTGKPILECLKHATYLLTSSVEGTKH